MKTCFLGLGSADDTLADISEVLNTDDDILGMISDDLAKSVDHSGMCQHRLPDSCLDVRCVCGANQSSAYFPVTKWILVVLCLGSIQGFGINMVCPGFPGVGVQQVSLLPFCCTWCKARCLTALLFRASSCVCFPHFSLLW